jgi:putative flippase GtrA
MESQPRRGAQLIRFAAVGLFCFVLGLAVIAALHELAGLHYLVAYIASFFVTSTLGYLLNGRFTFAANNTGSTGVIRYMLVNVSLLLLNSAALRLLVEHFHVWYLAACVGLAAINTPVGFIAHRLVAYRLGLGPATAATGE